MILWCDILKNENIFAYYFKKRYENKYSQTCSEIAFDRNLYQKKKIYSIHHVMDNYRATLVYIKLFIKENYYDDEDDAVHIMFIYSFDLLLL